MYSYDELQVKESTFIYSFEDRQKDYNWNINILAA